MKAIILHHQSLLDLAVQHTGTAENAFDLALANNRSITDDLEAGESIELTAYGIQQNKDILNYYTAKNIQPATAISQWQIANSDKPEGIGYWAIQMDFYSELKKSKDYGKKRNIRRICREIQTEENNGRLLYTACRV